MGCSHSGAPIPAGASSAAVPEPPVKSKVRNLEGRGGFRSPAALPQRYFGWKLGEGNYAKVYALPKADELFPENPLAESGLAAKVISFSANEKTSLTRYEKAFREATVWHRVCSESCQFVVSILETFLDELKVVYVMERCDMSLSEHIAGLPRIDEYEVALVLRQVFRSLSHVHSFEVIHRDVKPSNFLVLDGVVKLSDFGVAVFADDIWERDNEQCASGSSPSLVVAGTAPFMSPEMVSSMQYTVKTDIWSAGCMAYLLLFGQFPHMPRDMSTEGMKQAIREGQPAPSFAPGLDKMFPGAPTGSYESPSHGAMSIVTQALNRDQQSRPSAKELLNSPYLACELSAEDREHLPSLRNMYKRACRVGGFEHVPLRDPESYGGSVKDSPKSDTWAGGTTRTPSHASFSFSRTPYFDGDL